MRLPQDPEQVRLSLGDHLDELRTRLIRCLLWTTLAVIGCFYFSEQLMTVILHPVLVTLEDLGLSRFVIHTSVEEKFLSYIKVSAVAGILVASPIIAFQLWQFVGAGLYPHERRLAYVFVPASVLNFFTGVGFFYFIVMPWGLQFLLGFGGREGGYQPIQPFIKISELLSFFVTMSLVFGAVFELPLVMMILTRVGIFTPADYAGKRRYAIMLAFVVGAVLTPPDVFSQIFLAIPLIGLYEIGILVSRWGAVRFDAEGKARTEWRGLVLILLPIFVVAGLVTGQMLAFGRREARNLEPVRLDGGATFDLLADLPADGPVDRSLVRSSNPRLRYLVARDLVASEAPVEELAALLEDSDPGVRLRVATGLAARGDADGFERLITDLEGEDPLAAYAAGRALHTLHGEVAYPAYDAKLSERREAAEGWRAWWRAR